MRSAIVCLSMIAALSACAPRPAQPAAEETAAGATSAADEPTRSDKLAPDVAAAAARGGADPRIPTVDPASITDASSPMDVMHAYVVPGSETLFAQESADAPTNEAEWARLQKGAADVIKGAELLKTASRAQGRAAWIADADTVIKATKVTAEKLAKKNADDLVLDDGDMMEGCTACHRDFRP